MTLVVLKKRFLTPVCLLICPLFQSVESEGIQRHRSCHPRLNRLSQASSQAGSMLSERSSSKDSFSIEAGLMSSEGWRFSMAAEFVLPSTYSSSSTRQAITYASVCFPTQCIFLLLSNRMFNSDTNTFHKLCTNTLYSSHKLSRRKIISFPPRRHNSREEYIRIEVGRAREKWVCGLCLRMRHKRNEPLAYQSRSQSPRAFWSAPRHGALE